MKERIEGSDVREGQCHRHHCVVVALEGCLFWEYWQRSNPLQLPIKFALQLAHFMGNAKVGTGQTLSLGWELQCVILLRNMVSVSHKSWSCL